MVLAPGCPDPGGGAISVMTVCLSRGVLSTHEWRGWGWGHHRAGPMCPGGPDVKFLLNKTFKWFARIISVLKVSNYAF